MTTECLPAVERDSRTTEQYLAAAKEELRTGETRKGRRMARQVLGASVEAGDAPMEAGAALVLSQAYVLDSRFRLAHAMSSRAHQLFKQAGNLPGVAEALAIHSYCASALGLDSAALQAACDSMTMHADGASAQARALGLNYMGVAASWTRDFATARSALEASIMFSRQAGDKGAALQPLINLCFTEVLQIVELERLQQGPADLAELERLVAQARVMADSGQPSGLHRATLDIGLLLLDFSSCFVASRRGHTKQADAAYLACLEKASRFPRTSWVQAVLWWARVERAVCYGDIEASIRSLHAMGEVAGAGEHAQLQALAKTLESTLRPALNQWDSNHGEL